MVNWVKAGVALLVVSAVALALTLLFPAPEPEPVTEAAPVVTQPATTVDPLLETSDWPCDHFRAVAADVNAGILTDSELREKLKEVRERASIGTPQIQTAATELLAAATSGSVVEIRAGFSEMSAACEAAGH